MSASSAQRPEQRLLNRRLFLCERTSFRAPKVLDAFQNIRMSEKAQSSNVCAKCAHAPAAPRPTYSRHPFFFYQNQMLLRTVNGTIVKLSGANNCWQMHLPLCTLHCTTTFIFLTFRNQDRSMYSILRNDFAAVIQKGSFLTLLSVEVKVRAFSFHSSFRKQPRYVMILLRLLSGLKNLSIL